jgi:hypothetical protein
MWFRDCKQSLIFVETESTVLRQVTFSSYEFLYLIFTRLDFLILFLQDFNLFLTKIVLISLI